MRPACPSKSLQVAASTLSTDPQRSVHRAAPTINHDTLSVESEESDWPSISVEGCFGLSNDVWTYRSPKVEKESTAISC
eukprot:3736049-Rhodomonas_salina.1